MSTLWPRVCRLEVSEMRLEEFLQDIAREYDALPTHGFHAPYNQLMRELDTQFDILSAFVRVEFTDRDPYLSADGMFHSIDKLRVLSVYRLADLPSGHPFERTHTRTGQTYNSIFHAVHDGLAHYPNRYSFGRVGEFKAFCAHCRLLSPLAQWAVATETLGQNAWYHFAPGRIGPKTFAPQKYALLSRATVDRALTEDFD